MIAALFFTLVNSGFQTVYLQADANVERLIDKLAMVSEEGSGFQSMGRSSMFLPTDSEAKFEGGIVGAPDVGEQETLTKLVSLGVIAVPSLLAHLEDSRATKLSIKHDMGMGGMASCDDYWPRYDEPVRQPKDVQLVNYYNGSKLSGCENPYTLKIGDLCYVALGQIVNRPLVAIWYQPTMIIVVNSPILHPTVAAAARQDWSGLTKEEHAASLMHDAEHPKQFLTTEDALKRLRYYYPDRLDYYAIEVLNRRPYDQRSIGEAIMRIGKARDDAQAKDVIDLFKLGHDASEIDMLGQSICETLNQTVYERAILFNNDDLTGYISKLGNAQTKYFAEPPKIDPYKTIADLDLIDNVLQSLEGRHSKGLDDAVRKNLHVLKTVGVKKSFNAADLRKTEKIEEAWLKSSTSG